MRTSATSWWYTVSSHRLNDHIKPTITGSLVLVTLVPVLRKRIPDTAALLINPCMVRGSHSKTTRCNRCTVCTYTPRMVHHCTSDCLSRGETQHALKACTCTHSDDVPGIAFSSTRLSTLDGHQQEHSWVGARWAFNLPAGPPVEGFVHIV